MKLIKSLNTSTVENSYSTKYPNIVIVETITTNNDGNKTSVIRLENSEKELFGNVTFIKPSFFEFIETRNPHIKYMDMDCDFWAFEEFVIDHKNMILEDVYNLIENDKFIYWYNLGHELFDHTKTILPYAKNYSYINSSFTNEHYDLDELIAYLKTHDWVVNKDELEIVNVPYYNVGDVAQYTINVNIKVDQKSYAEMYKSAKNVKNWSPKMNDFVTSYGINEDFDPMNLLPLLKNK